MHQRKNLLKHHVTSNKGNGPVMKHIVATLEEQSTVRRWGGELTSWCSWKYLYTIKQLKMLYNVHVQVHMTLYMYGTCMCVCVLAVSPVLLPYIHTHVATCACSPWSLFRHGRDWVFRRTTLIYWKNCSLTITSWWCSIRLTSAYCIPYTQLHTTHRSHITFRWCTVSFSTSV